MAVINMVMEQLTNGTNIRSADMGKLDSLKASIQSYGVMQPICARKEGDGYKVICGHRRFEAAKLANLETVPVIVTETKDGVETILTQLTENCQRKNLMPSEFAKAVLTVLDNKDITQAQVSTAISKSEALVSKYAKVGDFLSKNPDKKAEVDSLGLEAIYKKYCKNRNSRSLNRWEKDIVVKNIKNPNQLSEAIAKVEEALKELRDLQNTLTATAEQTSTVAEPQESLVAKA
ncbi:chromosome partitioning protein ParB [Candidatus Termititenax aidoneus]|uniref:Chromosome partitioning protein ParB n=1 Tax=Termititenax aidoneus TaxID=2218524 RepID=A0A388T9G9_TERA1|nr:chromosome partitioning protein ParB [Candidatus Termititenax aidoneus]